MQESDVRHHLIDNLKEYGHIEAIENMAGVGNPDVNYCFEGNDGWIEIKYRREPPKRASTPLLGKCLKPSQPLWFRKRLAADSTRTFFYLRIGDDFYLIPGMFYHSLEEFTHSEMLDHAVWTGRLRQCDWLSLAKILYRGYSIE